MQLCACNYSPDGSGRVDATPACAVKRVLVLANEGTQGERLVADTATFVRSHCGASTTVAAELFDMDDAKSVRVLDAMKGNPPELVVAFTEFFGVIALAAFEQASVVMTLYNDPVSIGLAGSLARPGKRATGYTRYRPLAGKRLELLRDTFGNLRSVTVLTDGFILAVPGTRDAIAAAARSAGMEARIVAGDTLEQALAAIDAARTDAIYVMTSDVSYRHPREIAQRIGRRNLPSVFDDDFFVNEGGALAIQADASDLQARLQQQIRAILDGAKASDIPFEMPRTTRVSVNLRTLRSFPGANQRIVVRAQHLVEGGGAAD